MTVTEPVVSRTGHYRWFICALLFAIVAINYVDRQVLSVLKPTLQSTYGWTETGYGDVVLWFQASYGIGYVIFGRIVDRVGAKMAGTIAITIWGIAHTAHAFFRTTSGFIWVRIPMGLGESGIFPCAIAASAEWFPKRERALAIGIFNAGTNVGAIVTPLIVPIITIMFGWQMAFIATGVLTFVCLAAWLIWYRRPREVKGLSKGELAYIESDPQEPQRPVAWLSLLKTRQTWAYIMGRFLIDPVWWTFLFWLPDFFSKRYGVDLKGYGPPLVAIYLIADVGSVLGGWRSSNLMKRGYETGRARKVAMFTCALFALPVAFAVYASSLWLAVLIIGLAAAAHQGFSANVYSIPGDLFPRWAMGSILGLGGLAGAIGGMLMSLFAANILETVGSYTPIFIFASVAYLFALLVVHLIVPSYAPVSASALSRK